MVERGNYGKYFGWVCIAMASIDRYSIEFPALLFLMIPGIDAPCPNTRFCFFVFSQKKIKTKDFCLFLLQDCLRIVIVPLNVEDDKSGECCACIHVMEMKLYCPSSFFDSLHCF